MTIHSKRFGAVCRGLNYALIQDDVDGWGQFSAIASLRMTERELAGLSFAALKAQSPDNAEMTADAAINGIAPTSFIDTPAGRRAIVGGRANG